uniref:Uncharacterized protein n=1 Tax=Potsystermes virus TaxID=2796626 RepID=A0A7T7K8Y6_9VIRU|nr:hypothetical protein 1 [Potsystermes virus]
MAYKWHVMIQDMLCEYGIDFFFSFYRRRHERMASGSSSGYTIADDQLHVIQGKIWCKRTDV